MRNLRIMDNATVQTFTYGLATAGAVYTTRQLINNRPEKLNPVSIVNGAFGLSNMTGFIPMMSDPIASMLGLNNLRFNRYGPRTDMLGIPALETINRAARGVGSAAAFAVPGADGDLGDALGAAPLIGNAYGFRAIFDAM